MRWQRKPLPRSCATDVRVPLRRPPQPAHSHRAHLGAERRGSGELQANYPRPGQDSDPSDDPNAALFRVRLRGSTRRLRFAVIFDWHAMSSLCKVPSAVALRISLVRPRAARLEEVTCDRG